MMKRISIVAFMLLIFISSELKAQQKPLFTNFIYNQFYYNPAVSASAETIDFRFLYRNQWAGLEGKPHTQTLSAYGALDKINLGLGGNIYHDQTGHLRTVGFNLSAAYGIRFGEDAMLSGGISAGMIHYKLGSDILIKESDDLAVLKAQEGKVAADIGLGIFFKRKGLSAGFSMPQVVQSSLEFDVDDASGMNKLMRHYLLSAAYRFKLSEKIEMEPSALLKTAKSAQVQVDVNLKAIYNKMLWLGLAYRSMDAVSILAGVTIKEQFQLGYSYDITTSNLNKSSNGSHEILLAYKLKNKSKTLKNANKID